MKQKWFRWLGLLVLLLAGSVAGYGQKVNQVVVTYDTSKPLETLGKNSKSTLKIEVNPQNAAKEARIDFTIPKIKVPGKPLPQALVEIKKAAGTQANGLKTGTVFEFEVSSRRIGDFPVEGSGTVTFIIRNGLSRIDDGTQASQKFDVEVKDTKVTGISVKLETDPDNQKVPTLFDLGGSCRAKVTFTPPEATDKTVRLAEGVSLRLFPRTWPTGFIP